MAGKIIWLASYPKSGNTWFRVYLSNLLRDTEEPVSINKLDRTPIASARNMFDEATGLSSAELTNDEIDNLRPDVYQSLSDEAKDYLYFKIHDAYTKLDDGRNLIPTTATKAAIYFVRNPLDVATSFAHHSNLPYDKMIAAMGNSDYAFCSKSDKLHNQLRQKLLTWSGHVESWTTPKPFPVHVMKYEEMKTNTFETFKKVTRFLGLRHTDEQILKALNFSSFEVLAEQEKKEGFKEKSQDAKYFFRKGLIGSWKEELENDLVKKIISDNEDVMKKYGYL